MNRELLENWLCGPDAPTLAPAEIATLLGVPWERARDTTLLRVAHRLRAARFVVSVLRDVFDHDREVRRWLGEPRAELGERSAAAALTAGRTAIVEELVVREWLRMSVRGDAERGHTVTPPPWHVGGPESAERLL